MENQKFIRDSFIFYRSFFNSLEKCPTEIQLPLFKAIARYALDYTEPNFSDSPHKQFAEAVWEGIRPQLDANYRRFINGCKGAEFGKLGGAPKGNQNARKKQPLNNPRTTPNDNGNGNGNENANVKSSIRTAGAVKKGLELPYSSIAFKDTWAKLCCQPKWKNKTVDALRMSLTKLAKYAEGFAIILMEDAIANNYQGLVFANTPENYEKWKKTTLGQPQPQRSEGRTLCTEDLL